MDEEKIACCPFCGGEALLDEIEAHSHGIATFMPDHPGSAIVSCAVCSAAMIEDSKEAVITKWNRRV